MIVAGKETISVVDALICICERMMVEFVVIGPLVDKSKLAVSDTPGTPLFQFVGSSQTPPFGFVHDVTLAHTIHDKIKIIVSVHNLGKYISKQ